MKISEAKSKLAQLQEKICAYQHAVGMISYDGVTSAPAGTASNRARTIGVLSEEGYKLTTAPETVELLHFLRDHMDDLNDAERRQTTLLLKDLNQKEKVPMEEFVAYQRLLVEADDIWHRAKETGDFALFEPYLTKIFDSVRRFAGYIAPEKKPYDYWLNEFEEGLNTEICDRFFATLRERLVPLIHRIEKAPRVNDMCLRGDFPEEAQDRLSRYLMQLMRLDPDHVGLGVTEHPFTTSLGSHLDERITTHYYREDFTSSMYSVIHEGGHALYDTGSREEFAFTVLDCGVSMGIHESQSRFYENILGRSRPFVAHITPKLQELFPTLRQYSAEEIYRAVNRVQPSLIRTDADEVTYCLHVMVRYELEKRVMAGELAVHDLPAEWNRLYREYLGVDVPDDRHGVLQDSHWSGGGIGYFPSYALGSAYGVQFLRKMKESVRVEDCLARGDFAPINEWNRTHIWQYGRLHTPGQILADTLGEPFDPNVYLDYLEEKVKDVYGV